MTASARGYGWGKKKIDGLTSGSDLIILFFPKDVYRRSLFFFLALANVFEKNEKKNKPTSVYRLATYSQLFKVFNLFMFHE